MSWNKGQAAENKAMEESYNRGNALGQELGMAIVKSDADVAGIMVALAQVTASTLAILEKEGRGAAYDDYIKILKRLMDIRLEEIKHI